MAADHRSIGNGELPRFDPNSGENGSLVLSWNVSDELTQIDKTIGDLIYRKTFTWSGGNLVTVSEWVEL